MKNIYTTDKSLLETTVGTGGMEFLNVCYIAWTFYFTYQNIKSFYYYKLSLGAFQ